MRTWAARGGDERTTLAAQVGVALQSAAEWFGPPKEADDQALVAAGIKSRGNPEIFNSVRAEVWRLAEELGLALPELTTPDFSAWTPATRRVAPGGPDGEILSHLRGDRNDLFKRS